MTDNDTFLKFIQGQGEQNYDSLVPDVPLKTTITNKKLQKVDTIGEIQGIFVTSRYGWHRPDGRSSEARTKTLKGQSQIRVSRLGITRL